jgi:hypothetical protein
MKQLISSIIKLYLDWRSATSLFKLSLARELIKTARKSGLLAFIVWISVTIPVLYLGGTYAYKNHERVEVADSLAGETTRLRMLAYGYDNEKKLHFRKLMELDLLMQNQVYYENYTVKIRRLTPETIDGILDIFDMEKGDKEKFNIFNEWFSKRYIPTYRAFAQALYSIQHKPSFDKIDELKPLQMVDYLTRVDIPPFIYETRHIPVFDNPTTNTKKSDVDDKFTVLIKLAKEKINDTKYKAEADEIEKRNTKIKEQNHNRLE